MDTLLTESERNARNDRRLPGEYDRTPYVPLHGWTTAAVAVFGHRLFHEPALMRGLNVS